ncbi:unnamed protein product, partial [Didymodactylos carnosus]
MPRSFSADSVLGKIQSTFAENPHNTCAEVEDHHAPVL